MKRLVAAIASASLIGACTAPPPPGARHPAHELGIGLGYIVASPILILAGLAEGIAAAPYFVDSDLQEMNSAMTSMNAEVDLDRTYRYAYGASLAAVPPDGDTGGVFRHLAPATQHFQRVLRGYGVEDARNYLLTAVRTADRDGYTLYALVYRPDGMIRVRQASGEILSLTPADDAYYRPYARDASGRPLDMVIDWAGVPRTSIRTQKGQAILMTLGANSVLINRRSDEFWQAEKQWRAGRFVEIATQRKASLDRRMS